MCRCLFKFVCVCALVSARCLTLCCMGVFLLILRYAFLFDKAMFVCKKKSGETFELKETIQLQNYQIRDETSGEKENKKVFSTSSLDLHLLPTVHLLGIHKANCLVVCVNSGLICSCCWTAMEGVAMICSLKPKN